MKLRYALFVALAAVLLAGCTFTLASDITPPPNYIPPTPMPTLGQLYPSTPPDITNGAAIFADKCSACHGSTGMGDGPQSMNLPVTVPGIGLPDIARSASPAQWFTIVTQGQMDRYMPPFVSLSDQERWDVVAYVLSLHTKPDQLAKGKQLFEANCPDCASKFTDQKTMAALSEDDLVRIIKNGDGANIPAFGANLSDDDARAVAMYLRSLTFATPTPPTATPIAATVSTETPVAVSGTPSTPAATSFTPSTPQAANTTPETAAATSSTPGTPVANAGTITGTIQLAAGGTVPAGMTVTLHGFDHSQDPNSTATPQEVVTMTTTSATDGSFTFSNVDMSANRIFYAEVTYNGIGFQSDFATVKSGDKQLALTPIKLYESSTDTSLLKIQQVHFYSDFATTGTALVIEIYAFTNPSDKAVIISPDGNSVSFIKLPDGGQNAGFEAGQDSAPFTTANNGVAVVPSDKSYSIIAFFTMPYDGKKLEINQPFLIDAPSVLLLFPEGMTIDGKQLTSQGSQTIQNANYQEFVASNIKAGDTLTFTVSGQPSSGTASNTTPNTSQTLLIGAGILGIVLIGAGAWMYFRDRNRENEEDEEDEFDSADEVLDAILALDDLHRAGKISDEAYQKRRNELKETLKGMS